MRLDDIILLLKALPIFRHAELEAMRLLAFSAQRRQMLPGDVLFRKGDPGEGGFLVVEGEILLDNADNGTPSPHRFRSGALIGQAALFTPVERPATALVREPTQLLVLSRPLVARVVDAYPQSGRAMRDAIIEEARQWAEALARNPIRARSIPVDR